jgi:hypothetical protein
MNYIHWRRAISLLLAMLHWCPQGRVRILFVETRKRKVSSKVIPTDQANQPINPPNQTSQKQSFIEVGAKEATKRRAGIRNFFSD